jgi:hypothetical protein
MMPGGYGYTTLNGIQPAAADDNLFVTIVDMKVATPYTVATPAMPEVAAARHITLKTPFDGNADTPGTILVTGTNLAGQVISETLTPSAVDATEVEGTKWFKTVTAVQGAGWVIDGNADHLIVGCGALSIIAEGSGVLHGIQINTTANGVITITDAATLSIVLPVNVAVGTFYLWDVAWSGYLRITMAAASNITVMHSGSRNLVYSL